YQVHYYKGRIARPSQTAPLRSPIHYGLPLCLRQKEDRSWGIVRTFPHGNSYHIQTSHSAAEQAEIRNTVFRLVQYHAFPATQDSQCAAFPTAIVECRPNAESRSDTDKPCHNRPCVR